MIPQDENHDWTIGFNGPRLAAFACVRCPCCLAVTYFELFGTGAVPFTACCGHPPKYPDSKKYQEHLYAKPKLTDVELAERSGKTVVLGVRPALVIVNRRKIPFWRRGGIRE